MPELVRLVPDYQPGQDPELFEDRNRFSLRSYLKFIGVDARKNPYLGLASSNGRTISKVLDNLLLTAEDSPRWEHWRYDNRRDRLRIFTPSFYVPGVDNAEKGQHTRLHIATPDGFGPQPIIHIERADPNISFGHMYEGQELVWNRGSKESPMFGIYLGEDLGRAPIGSTYWDHAVKTLVAAHVKFCEG